MGLRLVSADSHFIEPADLWSKRLDVKFRDQSPHVVKNANAPGYSMVAPGVVPWPVSAVFGAGKSGEELKEHLARGYEAAPPSGWDPAVYDRFWTAAQELGMPVSLHIGTGKKLMQRDKPEALRMTGTDFWVGTMDSVNLIHRTLCSLIFGRTLERFPGLKSCQWKTTAVGFRTSWSISIGTMKSSGRSPTNQCFL